MSTDEARKGESPATLRIRQSEIAEFKRCRRKWFLKYRLQGTGLELLRDPNQPIKHLDLGTYFHRCHEMFWTKGVSPSETAREIQQEVINMTDGPLSSEWVKDLRMLLAMAGHYEAWLDEGELMGERVLAVEEALEVPFGEFKTSKGWVPVIIHGRADRRSEDTFTGQQIVTDAKSASKWSGQQLHAFQVKTYGLMYKKLGIPIHMGYTEEVKKVLGTGTAKPPFVLRQPLFLNEDMLRRHEEHLRIVLDQMVTLITLDLPMDSPILYPTEGEDCSWKCDFLGPCMAMDDGSNHEYMIETIYRRREAQ